MSGYKTIRTRFLWQLLQSNDVYIPLETAPAPPPPFNEKLWVHACWARIDLVATCAAFNTLPPATLTYQAPDHVTWCNRASSRHIKVTPQTMPCRNDRLPFVQLRFDALLLHRPIVTEQVFRWHSVISFPCCRRYPPVPHSYTTGRTKCVLKCVNRLCIAVYLRSSPCGVKVIDWYGPCRNYLYIVQYIVNTFENWHQQWTDPHSVLTKRCEPE
jgi:hypothetical protein